MADATYRCPKCVESGEKSRVYIGASFSTCMASSPYYDEEGVYRANDPNIHSTSYSCSNGHSWTTSTCRGASTVTFHGEPFGGTP